MILSFLGLLSFDLVIGKLPEHYNQDKKSSADNNAGSMLKNMKTHFLKEK